MKSLLGIFAKSSPLKPLSRIYDLKARLDWGEPALTIVDIRDRTTFNYSHIAGAISMPSEELLERAQMSLEFNRDIYIYADTDEEAEVGANQLRAAGYQRVAVVRGGVAAWKAASFPVESTSTILAY